MLDIVYNELGNHLMIGLMQAVEEDIFPHMGVERIAAYSGKNGDINQFEMRVPGGLFQRDTHILVLQEFEEQKKVVAYFEDFIEASLRRHHKRYLGDKINYFIFMKQKPKIIMGMGFT